MNSTETSTSYTLDASPTLMIWSIGVFAFFIVLAVLFVVMFRRRHSEFKSQQAQRRDVLASRIAWSGGLLALALDLIIDSAAFASVMVFTVLGLITARAAINVASRKPRSPRQPALS